MSSAVLHNYIALRQIKPRQALDHNCLTTCQFVQHWFFDHPSKSHSVGSKCQLLASTVCMLAYWSSLQVYNLSAAASLLDERTLLMATTMGTSAALAWLMASSVCGRTPSSAATTIIAMSVTRAPRARIALKACRHDDTCSALDQPAHTSSCAVSSGVACLNSCFCSVLLGSQPRVSTQGWQGQNASEQKQVQATSVFDT